MPELADTLLRSVEEMIEDARRYLATPEGRRMRKKIAMGLLVSAPLISRLPFFRRTPVGKIVTLVGGAAVISRFAEWLRDWEPDDVVTIKG